MKYSIILILLFCSIGYSQGVIDGFFKGKNNLDMALGGFYQHSEKFYGITTFNYPRTLVGGSLFAAYGIRNDLDVVASIPFINGNFQDASLFFKYCIPHSRFAKERRLVIIPAFGFSLPMSNYPVKAGNAIGQQATQFIPKLVLHWSTKYGVYFTGQVGYNYNLSPVPSSLSASFKTAVGGKKMVW